jgi:hypothetical protein
MNDKMGLCGSVVYNMINRNLYTWLQVIHDLTAGSFLLWKQRIWGKEYRNN